MKVKLDNIVHFFGNTQVLSNVNLDIEEGKLFTLLGPSGCGKTTILRIIAGFLKPTSGKIFVGEKDITNIPPEKRNIGTIFQNYALFPHMTVAENIEYGLKIKGLSKNQIKEQAKTYLDLVGLYTLRDRKITELSGGQQQRVAIARSLAVEPQVLLLDEPMSNLDAVLREKMREEIRSIQQRLKITTLFITHDQKEALSISDKIAVMQNGSIIQAGTPLNIYNNPINGYIANFIGESNAVSSNDFPKLHGTVIDCVKYIRPEQLEISLNCLDNNSIKGKIISITFEGSIVRYIVQTENARFNIIELMRLDSIKKIGDIVYLRSK